MAVENLAISNGIEDGEISLLVSSKRELNPRPDHRSNNRWLIVHPRVDVGPAHTALLIMGEAIGAATEAISLALKAAVG